MVRCRLFLAILWLVATAKTANAYSITWDAVTTNADDTPITDLAGYRIWACNGNVPTCNKTTPGVTGATNPLLGAGITTYTPSDQTTVKTWFVTAVDTTGNESGESNVVLGPIDTKPPKKPGNLRIIP